MMNKNFPLLSVIVPVYNGQDTIARTLDSIVNQNYSNVEVVVINDGSTDNTESIIKQYIDKYKDKIILKSIVNGGLANARNVGWSIARGEYCCNLDSDDFLEQGIFKKIFDSYESFDICYYGFRDVDENLNVLADYNKSFNYVNNISGMEAARLKLLRKIWICQGSCLYRKELFTEETKNVKGINQGEDLLFITSMLASSSKVVCVDSIGVNIVCSSNSMMHRPFNESFYQSIFAAEKLVERFTKFNYDSNLIDLACVEVNNQVSRVCKSIIFAPKMTYQEKKKLILNIRKQHFVYSKSCIKLLSRKKKIEFGILKKSVFIFYILTKMYRCIS